MVCLQKEGVGDDCEVSNLVIWVKLIKRDKEHERSTAFGREKIHLDFPFGGLGTF